MSLEQRAKRLYGIWERAKWPMTTIPFEQLPERERMAWAEVADDLAHRCQCCGGRAPAYCDYCETKSREPAGPPAATKP